MNTYLGPERSRKVLGQALCKSRFGGTPVGAAQEAEVRGSLKPSVSHTEILSLKKWEVGDVLRACLVNPDPRSRSLIPAPGKQGVAAHTCNPTPRRWRHDKFEASLAYVRPCLKNK